MLIVWESYSIIVIIFRNNCCDHRFHGRKDGSQQKVPRIFLIDLLSFKLCFWIMHGDKRWTLHVHTLGLLLRYRFGFVLVLLLGMCCFVLGIWCRKPLQSYGRYVRQKNKWMAQNMLEIHISIHHNGKNLEHVLKDQPIDFWLNFQALFLYCAFTYEKLKLIDYEYPLWAHIVGMCMGIVSTAFVPLYFLYSLIISPGNKVSEVTLSEVFKMENTLLISFLYFTEIPQCNDVSFTRILRS